MRADEQGDLRSLAVRVEDSVVTLTPAMRDLLWTVAQHKYGWAHCPNISRAVRRFQTAEALERRGLVAIDRSRSHPTCSATDAGRAEIERLWPVSPFALGTYDHQPGGWTPVEGARAQHANALPTESAPNPTRREG